MKRLTLLLAALIAALACVGSIRFVQADAAPAVVVAPVPSAPAAPPAAALELPVQVVSVEQAALESYAFTIMNGWTHAVPQMPVADYASVAHDIGMVSATPHDAVLLAGLAYWEGARYAAYVDDGSCNDPDWRKSAEGVHLMHLGGNCDNGHAHSLWQVHPIEDATSSLYALCNKDVVDFDRLSAARCALTMANASLARQGNLSDYTGEWGFEHPKADVRLDFVKHALATHPFQLPRE